MTTTSHHILLIWNRMGDYHRARWNTLQQQWNRGHVFAADLGRGDHLYKWSTTHDSNYFCLSEKPVHERDVLKRFRQFRKIMREQQIGTVCIPGYGRPEYIFFLVWCRLKGIRVILFGESWYGSSRLKNYFKGRFLNKVVDVFFVSGVRAETHFHERLGIPLKEIRKGYSVVDNDHFARREETSGETTETGSPRMLLCVARYSEEKNLVTLIKAYRQSALYRQWKLVLIGDGPQKQELTDLAGKDAGEWILLEGWKTYEELPHWYHRASAFILPSLFEPWGLVVNEAMAAGLPIFVSENAGCTDDMVEKGKNGFGFQPDLKSIIQILNDLLGYSDLQLHEFGKYSQIRISDFSLNTWVQTLIKI